MRNPFAYAVGYQSVTIPTGYSAFIPTFENCDATTFTLKEITVCNKDGDEFNNVAVEQGGTGVVGGGKLNLRRCSVGKTFALGSSYAYRSVNYGQPDNENSWAWGVNRDQELQPGEGILVYNNMGEEIVFRTSGQVILTPVRTLPQGYSVWGNNTPVDIILKDITVCNKDGDEFNNVDPAQGGTGVVGGGKLNIRRLSVGKTAALGASYAYRSVNYGQPDNENSWAWGVNREQVIKAGEAILVYNNFGDEIIFKTKSPVAK